VLGSRRCDHHLRWRGGAAAFSAIAALLLTPAGALAAGETGVADAPAAPVTQPAADAPEQPATGGTESAPTTGGTDPDPAEPTPADPAPTTGGTDPAPAEPTPADPAPTTPIPQTTPAQPGASTPATETTTTPAQPAPATRPHVESSEARRSHALLRGLGGPHAGAGRAGA
jgi:hypothetical protein